MKTIHFALSSFVYCLFLLVFTYLLIFLGGPFLEAHVGLLAGLKTVNDGPVMFAIPGLPAGIANALLILAFGLQHSVMARPAFKALVKRVIPEHLERSFYVLCTCLVLIWFYLAWQPMTHELWQFGGAPSLATQVAFAAGAGLVLWSTFMISHGQLFGIAQAWAALRGTTPAEDTFRTPALYRYSRHPMYLGILVVFWATPIMTVGHFLAASLFSIYVFIGIGYEERDLLANFGEAYRDYMQRVPQLLPLGRR